MAVSDKERAKWREDAVFYNKMYSLSSGGYTSEKCDRIIALLDDLDERGCEHGDVLRSNIGEAISAWRAYVAYLQAKYPAAPGTLWALTCPHHKRIDAIFRNIDKVGGK